MEWILSYFVEWSNIYLGSQAILHGNSPYFNTNGFFHPPAVAILLAPTTLLPFPAWIALMMALNALATLWLVRSLRQAALALVWIPGLLTLLRGNLGLLLMALGRRAGGIGLAFLALKPQLAILIAPAQLMEWIRERNGRAIVSFVVVTGLLWLLPLAASAQTYRDWLSVSSETVYFANRSSWAASFLVLSRFLPEGQWLAVGVMLVVVFWTTMQVGWRILTPLQAMALNASVGLVWIYDWAFLAETATWPVVLASYGLWLVSQATGTEVWFGFLGIGILMAEAWRARHRKPSLADVIVSSQHSRSDRG